MERTYPIYIIRLWSDMGSRLCWWCGSNLYYLCFHTQTVLSSSTFCFLSFFLLQKLRYNYEMLSPGETNGIWCQMTPPCWIWAQFWMNSRSRETNIYRKCAAPDPLSVRNCVWENGKKCATPDPLRARCVSLHIFKKK